MKVTGIIAEFNPFHSGHRRLLDLAAENGSTHIAVVMSGSLVQRGEPAVISKYSRAQTAVRNGADLVIELPAPYSVSAAEIFADAAVSLLCRLGIDEIAFGSEIAEKDLFYRAAAIKSELSDSSYVRKLLSDGKTYPEAVAEAVQNTDREAARLFSHPNSLLGAEYTASLVRRGAGADIFPVKREGAAHDSGEKDIYVSGSYLRKRMLSGCEDGSLGEYMPPFFSSEKLSDFRRSEQIVYYGLLTADKETLTKVPEISEPLADRILNAAKRPPETLEEFLLAVKSKNCTMARLRRAALQLAIGAEKSDLSDPPYARILALNKKGTEILKRAGEDGILISASLRKLENSSPQAKRICGLEKNASVLFGISGGGFENEYTRKISVTD